MATKKSAFSLKFFSIFALLSFFAGFVLVIASRQNTERRSQASDGPYSCSAACSPAAGGIGGAACIACMEAQTTPSISPTPSVNPWGNCMQWDAATGVCLKTYWQYVEDRENDWRCKDVWKYLNLCDYVGIAVPGVPRPEEDPGLNPGQ